MVALWAVAIALGVAYTGSTPPETQPPPSGPPVRPKVFQFDVATLSEIRIDHGGRRIVARRDGDDWAIEEPAGTSVPSDLVKAFATAALEAEEIQRVGEEADLKTFGLDGDATKVELVRSGGAPETLWLGAANPAGTAVYARRLGSPDVILVGRTLRYYEELIRQALPAPSVPADTAPEPVGGRAPLTSRGRPV